MDFRNRRWITKFFGKVIREMIAGASVKLLLGRCNLFILLCLEKLKTELVFLPGEKSNVLYPSYI